MGAEGRVATRVSEPAEAVFRHKSVPRAAAVEIRRIATAISSRRTRSG
jgi:hypothetical protein